MHHGPIGTAGRRDVTLLGDQISNRAKFKPSNEVTSTLLTKVTQISSDSTVTGLTSQLVSHTTNEFDGNLDLKGASLRNTLVAGTYVAQYCGGSSF